MNKPEETKKWQPKPNEYVITSNGQVGQFLSMIEGVSDHPTFEYAAVYVGMSVHGEKLMSFFPLASLKPIDAR